MAVKAGGPDPNNNSKLRDVIAKAKANNMPNDTIDRASRKQQDVILQTITKKLYTKDMDRMELRLS